AVMKQVGVGAAGGDDAVAARGERTIDDAILGQDAGEIHLGDGLDDARAADAGNAEPSRVGGEAVLVGPVLAADDAEARLERVRIDAYALDGARRGALS